MNKKMNKIEKLIAELCPEGVEHKPLGEIATITRGVRVVKSQLTEDGKYPVYQNSMTPLGYYEASNCPANTAFVISAGAAGEIGYSTIDFWAADDCFYFVCPEQLQSRFLYYALLCQQNYLFSRVRRASVPRLARSVVEGVIIPIPPLAVQQEIVKILDTFTTLEAELEAELEARKKQYEYYRDELLTFGDEVEWKTLGEIGKVSMCKRIFKNETLAIGDIPFYKIGTFGKEPDAFISRELFDEYRNKFSFPKKGDVLLSASGTIGRCVIYDGEPAYFQDSNIIWIDNDESKVLNKFLYYLYAIIEWKTEGGTIQRLYNDNLKKIKIPIPPLSEQERIVAILDKFDALVNDISVGLPAELNARRKQYEYYRDKLLTFKERHA